MGETGKRSRRDIDNDDKYERKRVNNNNNNSRDKSGDGELVVYRILCPNFVIGSVIGKSGKVINSLREDTHSKIKVVDPFPGAKERVILIYCYVKDKDDQEVDEDEMAPLCPAQDALLQVHAAIANTVATGGDSDTKRKDNCCILVPGSQVANVIGKLGSTIKKLRTKTKTYIKVTRKDPEDPSHSCAMDFDHFVQITGDSVAVNKALFAISTIMYKFSPKEKISLDTTVPDPPPSIIIPSDIPIYPNGSFFPGADTIVPPSSSVHPVGSTLIPELNRRGDNGVAWPIYSSLPAVSGYGGQSQSEELKVRVLCPTDKIGRVIGKGGSSIKNVRQTSGAHVEVEDPIDDCDESVISVTSTEATDDVKSSAIEAVILLLGKINDDDDDDDDTVHIRLLVSSKVIGCIIGKSGSVINDIRKKTKADVCISKHEKPKCAEKDDELVEVNGEFATVRDALVQIVLRLRDRAFRDKEGGHNGPATEPPQPALYSRNISVQPSILPSIPPLSPLGYDQSEAGSGLGMHSSNSLYRYGSLQTGDNGYGSHSYLSKPFGGLPPTHDIVIPANAVGKVMGKGGANLANIQKISGASVEVTESKSSRSDRIAHISGTPEQKRAAENLIQAFILST